jgi:hypothetical protein
VQIFVVDNQGGEDETRIDGIDVFGTPVECVQSRWPDLSRTDL